MQIFLPFSKKRMIISLMLCAALGSAAAFASDKVPSSSNLLSAGQSVSSELINLLNYFKSNYPQSPYAQLSEQQQQQLLAHASILMHKNNANKNDALSAALKELTESPNVLKQEEKVTIDPQLINLLNALKSNYPNSPYAQLSEEEQQQLLARASILTHEQNKILVLMAPCLQH